MTSFPKVDPAQVTPEHLQLLSDARLRDLAGEPADRPAAPDPDPAWRRLARYELKRRRAAVQSRARALA